MPLNGGCYESLLRRYIGNGDTGFVSISVEPISPIYRNLKFLESSSLSGAL